MDIQTRIRTHVAGVPETVPMLRAAWHAFGSPEEVDAALGALVAEGMLLEVAEGVFGKAVRTKFGVSVGFGAWEVAKAITEADGHQIGYIPLAWANMLHLSHQVVAKVIYMTDGPDRVISYGKGTIQLEQASAEDVRLSQSAPGGAVLGLPHADTDHPQESIRMLHRLFNPDDWATFLREANARGGWVAQVVSAYVAAQKPNEPQGIGPRATIVLIEVEPNADGPWDPDTELELGVFSTRSEAIQWLEANLADEGWSEEEWRQWPAFGTQGSRFQFQETELDTM